MEFLAEMLNYLLDQLNERSNLNFLLLYFASNEKNVNKLINWPNLVQKWPKSVNWRENWCKLGFHYLQISLPGLTITV